MATIASTIYSCISSSQQPQSIQRSNRSPSKPSLLSRRQSLFIATVPIGLTVVELTAKAEDIGLFGLRKKLKKVEEEAEELVKEGIENVEKVAEKEIEQETEALSAGGSEGALAQAGLVLGAEALGVLIATSVVNAILAP